MARQTHSSWLLPREHGAWGIVLIPFLTAAVIAGGFHWPVWLALAVVLAGFIARYPLELLWVPGLYRRAGSPDRAHTRRLALAYILLTLVLGSFLILRWELFILVPLGGLAMGLFLLHVWAGREDEDRSLAMELVGTVGLTFSGLVGWIAATGGLDRTGLLVWALNAVFFCSGILYVKARLRSRLTVHRPDLATGSAFMVGWHLALVALVAALVSWQRVSPVIILPFVAAAARAVWGARQSGQPFALRRLGWSEVALSVFFALFLTLGFRL